MKNIYKINNNRFLYTYFGNNFDIFIHIYSIIHVKNLDNIESICIFKIEWP